MPPHQQTTRLLSILLVTSLLLSFKLVNGDTTGGVSSDPNSGDDNSSSSSDGWKNLICAIVIGITSVLLILISYRIYTIHASRHDTPASTTAEGQQESDETRQRNWKIEYSDLEIGALIGGGSIGKVYKGKWRGLTVAVKEVIHTASENEVHEELALLIRVRHPNLCLFMGLAMPTPEKLSLVSEHMSRGNLYTVLHDKSQKLDWKRRISMALDAARAMNYLHLQKPCILHKSLNSINLLVDKEYVTKVCDYAIDTIRTAAKKSGVYTQPLWVAPELFKSKGKSSAHTKACDVYSFGIILWEILTRKTPYQGIIKGGISNNIKALQEISNGLRPVLPDKCPVRYADLIRKCWAQDPLQRPDFQMIVEELGEIEKEKHSTQEQYNQWLKQQNELEEIAIATHHDEKESTFDSLLTGENKKSWMISSSELKYEELIGHGSFGEVWTGVFRGKKVAVKKLMNGSSGFLRGGGNNANGIALARQDQSSTAMLKDFLRELNLMCSLRHPNCVLFLGAVLEEGHYALVMEYCSRGNLYQILHDQSQPIDYNLILKVLIEVAEGILYLHLNKPTAIIHRDLKSANILVDEDWNVKVSDFGLTEFKPDASEVAATEQPAASSSGPNNSSSSTAAAAPAPSAGLQAGTPFWQAPEVLESNTISESSDIYSFGMIIYELFTREIPFKEMNPHQAALAVISEDKRPDIPNFVPPKFVQLMKDCWGRDPKTRPTLDVILERLAILKKEGLPRIELSLGIAKLYRKKTTVFAFKSKDAVIVYKPWGTGEGKKGDWVLVGPGDDVYTCDAAIFLKTYSLVDASGAQPHLYRKTGSIFAYEMPRDFLMETLEGMEHGSKGDWIAQNPVDGEQWPIASKTFAAMYELAPSQELPAAAVPMKRKDGKTALGALQEEKEQEEETTLVQRRKA